MPRLVYRKTARRDLAEIASFIEHESQDRAVAKAFVNRLIRYCEHLARLPGLLGRPRPELGPGYRSTTFGRYVIFLRYADKDSQRSHLYIVHILHGSRDLDAYFSQHSDNQGKFELNEEISAGYVAHVPEQIWSESRRRDGSPSSSHRHKCVVLDTQKASIISAKNRSCCMQVTASGGSS